MGRGRCVLPKNVLPTETNVGNANARFAPATLASVGAGVSYAASCGSCDGVDGDGVTPLRSAMLRGATEIVLEGVTHKAKPTNDESGDAWYGAAPVVRTWAPELFA